MKKWFMVGMPFVLLALLALAIGCGGSEPAAATATTAPTSIPPTVAPTDTPVVVPTNTTAAPSGGGTGGGDGTGTGGGLGGALKNAQTATVYRLDLSMTAKGNLGLGTPEPGAADQEVPLFSLKGEVNGKDAHFSMGGFIAAFLGADPTKGLEFVNVGDKSYLHGPVPLMGANEDKWYVLPAEQSTAAQPPLTPGTLLESLTSSGFKPEDFQLSGKESLDNRSCDVYVGDKDTVTQVFNKVSSSSGTTETLENISQADMRMWVCDDNYLHQMKMFVEGSSKDKPEEKQSFNLLMHIYDINGNIKILAPSDASPLSVPSFGLPSPTP